MLRSPAVPSLLQVLHDASGHGANEIVLEADRAPTMRTQLGVESLGVVLSEGELFDALGAVLPPEQQAELAVGNLVEFQVHDGTARWTLVAEAGREGVVVRGRTGSRSLALAEVGTPLELPPLAKPTGDGATSSVPRAPGPLAKRRDTAWDLPVVASTPPPTADAPPRSPPPSWLLGGTPEFDHAPASTRASSGVDFAMRRRETAEPPAALGDPLDLPPPPSWSAGEADAPRAAIGTLTRQIPEGSLVFVRGVGNGERLARAIAPYDLVSSARDVGTRRTGGPAVYVVRLEDPSEVLGWALRRIEEGARVVIETGARTLAGARRGFLGIHAGPAAEQWVAAVTVLWAAPDGERWSLAPGGS